MRLGKITAENASLRKDPKFRVLLVENIVSLNIKVSQEQQKPFLLKHPQDFS